MKIVNNSSAECAKHNTENAKYIDAGIIEIWQPSPEVLAREERIAALAKATDERMRSVTAFLRELVPAVEVSAWGGEYHTKAGGVSITLKRQKDGAWRLVFWFSSEIWMRVGAGSILGWTGKQLDKAKGLLSAQQKAVADRIQAEVLQKSANERYVAFRAVEAGLAFLKRLTGLGFVPDTYAPDGLTIVYFDRDDIASSVIYYRNERFMVKQWEQILDLRESQAAAMAALKASFQS